MSDTAPKISREELHQHLEQAVRSLLNKQHEDGHWCFELEADCTIPAEYILMLHALGDLDEALEKKIAVYLRRRQLADGGWPLYYGGTTDISCTVKCYYALKLVGDDPDAPHMLRARRVVLERGGAARANVFTRIMLAMFEQIPWRGVPFIPVEIMLLPEWFFFHINKVSYWSRTVMVPLFVLCTRKFRARNPRGIGIPELFTTPPEEERHYFPVKTALGRLFLILDKCGRTIEPFIPVGLRDKATERALAWFKPRLNGTDGLGAIFPAMVNAYEALIITGHDTNDPARAQAREALDRLLVQREDEAYCQPCVSPVWDTALTALALQELGSEHRDGSEAVQRALAWLRERQIDEVDADWKAYRPNLPSGGWAFQYNNDYYPDLDDTAAVACALHNSGDIEHHESVRRAAAWIIGMQSENGGFAAFDADNTCYYLNEIPFADHGALLDPPTADVSARCVMLLGHLSETHPEFAEARQRALDYLSKEQEQDGSWFGRWGTNHIYGTWSALTALEAAGVPNDDPRVRRAVSWLQSVQNPDGGWGEDNDSYAFEETRGLGYRSSAFQTAWALIALMSAGETDSDSVARGVCYLLKKQTEDGLWQDPEFTAPGFPRVFYLKYHGYDKFFPVWALARYRRETSQ